MTGAPGVVLVVDADPSVHDAVSAALGAEWAVLGCRKGEVALRLAARRPPAVLIVDEGNVDRSPEALIKEMRALQPQVRAVILLDGRKRSGVSELRALGTLVPKPIDPERLRQAVGNAARFQRLEADVDRLFSQTGQFRESDPGRSSVPPSSGRKR